MTMTTPPPGLVPPLTAEEIEHYDWLIGGLLDGARRLVENVDRPSLSAALDEARDLFRRARGPHRRRVEGRCLMVCKTTGKFCYESRKAAKTGRRRQPKLRVGSSVSGSVRPYRCGHCDAWHLGHMPSAAVRSSRAEVFDGVRPAKRPKPPKLKLAPKPRVRGPVVISAHVFFQMRLCERPKCGHEEPCPVHSERRDAA
jgi:hypothetical protein